jgi:uncharacterized protein
MYSSDTRPDRAVVDPAAAQPSSSSVGESERSSRKRFQILALDGGGYRGMYSAAALAALEEDLGIAVADRFDLIAGTSTGGIIALGLGLGCSPAEIVEFYTRYGPKIFGAPRRVTRLFRAKYASSPLADALGSVFADVILGESRVPVLIPAYELGADDVYLFRTPHHPGLTRDWRETMVDVGLATAAAPTYLPVPRRSDGLRFVDGGLWANNPALHAVVEAVDRFNCNLNDVAIFSIGTTDERNSRSARLDRGAATPWAGSAVPLIVRAQSRAANNAATLLAGRDSVLRLDPTVAQRTFRLDGHQSRKDLIGLARNTSRHITERFAEQFADHAPAPYKPCYGPNAEVAACA